MTRRPPHPARPIQRRPWRAAEFVSLDFEATGLDFARDAIISFGLVPIRHGRIDVGGSRYQLVDPGEVPPSPRSITVHMLRPADLAGAPSVDSAREALHEALAGQFLVTWWAGVEVNFLAKLFGGSTESWLRRTVDVRALMLALDPHRYAHATLTDVARDHGVPVTSPHHALDDALVTAQLFLICATNLEAAGYRDVRSLLRETRRPVPRLASVSSAGSR